jgi:hypothetical protein
MASEYIVTKLFFCKFSLRLKTLLIPNLRLLKASNTAAVATSTPPVAVLVSFIQQFDQLIMISICSSSTSTPAISDHVMACLKPNSLFSSHICSFSSFPTWIQLLVPGRCSAGLGVQASSFWRSLT